MTEWLTPFLGGILGSAHCIGMCGGFATLVGTSCSETCRPMSRQLTYHLGRVFTYSFLGAMCGFAGQYFSQYDTAALSMQRVFSIGAGILMILVGASTLGWLNVHRFRNRRSKSNLASTSSASAELVTLNANPPGSPEGSKQLPGKRLTITQRAASIFAAWLQLPGWRGVFLGGVANGFLPCGLVYAFLAMAVASGSAAGGMFTMSLFGLGTMPAMTLIGCGASLVSKRFRKNIFQVAAGIVIITGAICIQRGWAQPGTCCQEQQTGYSNSTSVH